MSISIAMIVFLIFLSGVFDTIGQLFLKHAINRIDFHISGLKKIPLFILKIALSPTAYISLAASLISFFLWLFVLSHAELSFAFSVDSFHYILIAMGSRIFLKEAVGLWRWVGTALIMTGVVLVSLTG